MILAFVDETSDRDNPRYCGLTLATININFYRAIKETFHRELDQTGWDPTIEFKGSYLFSASKGDTAITVDARVELVSTLLQLNASTSHRRMKFHYATLESPDQRGAYLTLLPLLLRKALSRPLRKGGKDLIKLYCDKRDDLKPEDIRTAVAPELLARGYTLVEDIVCPVSNRETVGILYADIVGYLMGRVDVISADIGLFADLTSEQLEASSRLKKLMTSTRLLQVIRKLDNYHVAPL